MRLLAPQKIVTSQDLPEEFRPQMKCELERVRLQLFGQVQGIGLRPTAYRLATELGLTGYAFNSHGSAIIELQGPPEKIDSFIDVLCSRPPANGHYTKVVRSRLPLVENSKDFSIVESHSLPTKGLEKTSRKEAAQVWPEDSASASRLSQIMFAHDLSPCLECHRELLDPTSRRFRYPFISCTKCGPRYTILRKLPFDRCNTTLNQFEPCAQCAAEYIDPGDIRFHAQTISCPDCGPKLILRDREGREISTPDPLQDVTELLLKGAIVAIKGVGGIHLMCLARSAAAVQTLRERKGRPDKPLAILAPSVEHLKNVCELGKAELRLFSSATAPIVLAEKHSLYDLPTEIAPKNGYVGVMLPYSPLTILLSKNCGQLLVCTSANSSGAPLACCSDEITALKLADFILDHDLEIANRCEDSVFVVINDRSMTIRPGRGCTPQTITTQFNIPPMMAMGAYLKNTVAMSTGNSIVISPQIGNWSHPDTLTLHKATRDFLQQTSSSEKFVSVSDAHPDFSASLMEPEIGHTQTVQHHLAHAYSCALDSDTAPPFTAICWDGMGYGLDDALWGGEVFLIEETGFERLHLQYFPLPGGTLASTHAHRSALGILFVLLGETAFSHPFVESSDELRQPLLRDALVRGINCPPTSSMGRLFDAVAALLGLADRISFEGQAACALQACALEFKQRREKNCPSIRNQCHSKCYPWYLRGNIIDWRPMLSALLNDIEMGLTRSFIAACFHETLVDICCTVASRNPEWPVLLSGGCFQNKLLLEAAIETLKLKGFTPKWHHRIAPNDAGISAGQLVSHLYLGRHLSSNDPRKTSYSSNAHP